MRRLAFLQGLVSKLFTQDGCFFWQVDYQGSSPPHGILLGFIDLLISFFVLPTPGAQTIGSPQWVFQCRAVLPVLRGIVSLIVESHQRERYHFLLAHKVEGMKPCARLNKCELSNRTVIYKKQ